MKHYVETIRTIAATTHYKVEHVRLKTTLQMFAIKHLKPVFIHYYKKARL